MAAKLELDVVRTHKIVEDDELAFDNAALPELAVRLSNS
jgi:hypothetical protein